MQFEAESIRHQYEGVLEEMRKEKESLREEILRLEHAVELKERTVETEYKVREEGQK